MTPAQVELVQDSFVKVAPIAEQAAALFYGRLFEIAPEVRSLFDGDMTEQGRKLMATLAVVVNGFASLDAILPAASALAKRHVAYGAKAEHYPVVGAGLALDPGEGPWRSLDARTRHSLDRRLRRAVRLHDFRGLRHAVAGR